MNNITKKIEKIIKINFLKKDLLKRSLTHKSYDNINSNEKLEFLGDRVLGLVISKRLLEIYPDEKEGILDKKLASLVNKKKCYEIGKSINLEKFIFISTSKKKIIKMPEKVISDCCEALIGAIYLDQGLFIVEKFILDLWKKDLNKSVVTFIDAKTKLQEYSLKRFKKLPIYKVIENSGPRHKPIFKISVKLDGFKGVVSLGSSKKEAEQNAASSFLKSINL